jgi:uncharacterized protein
MLALRLLFLFLIFYVVFSALKSLLVGKKKSADVGAIGEAMVLDPQCQTYVPQADAVSRGGKFFCSEECARLYLAR